MARPPRTRDISDGKTLREMVETQDEAIMLGKFGAFECVFECALSKNRKHVVVLPADLCNIDLDARPRFTRLVWCDWVDEKTAMALRPRLDEWSTGWPLPPVTASQQSYPKEG